MNLSEEQSQEMLRDSHCQDFIESLAAILVHQGNQPNQIEEEAEEAPIEMITWSRQNQGRI